MSQKGGVTWIVKKNRLPELAAELKTFAPIHNAETGFAIEYRAKQKAPFDTGFLRKNIGTEVHAGGNLVLVRARAEYSGYQEFGTRYQSGTKFLRPAVEEQTPEFIDGWKKFFDRFG
jgi:HK97 gp10 family phage protein